MPHSAMPSADTIASFTSEDFETTSIAVAQAAQKHHSTVLNLPTRRESMATAVPSVNDFSFVQQPLPSLPTPPEVKPLHRERSIPNLNPRPTTASSEATAVPADHDVRPPRRLQSLATRDSPHVDGPQYSQTPHVSSARERVTRDAPVIVELRTNVIINDEYTLTTDLSYHLSTRYQRPESAIAVTIQHSACLCLGGSFQPAYLLTITALSDLIHPAANKRNTALIQSFMSDTLAVPADRGIIRFLPIPEENIGTNSRTILDEIEKLEKLHAEEKKALNQSRQRSASTRQAKANENGLNKTPSNSARSQTNGQVGPPGQRPPGSSGGLGISQQSGSYANHTDPTDGTGVLINGRGGTIDNINQLSSAASPPQPSPVDSKMGSPQQQPPAQRQNPMHQVDLVGRKASAGKKSLGGSKKDANAAAALLAAQRAQGTASADAAGILPPPPPPPPPIPLDDERGERARKLGKRKSIISIFSRK